MTIQIDAPGHPSEPIHSLHRSSDEDTSPTPATPLVTPIATLRLGGRARLMIEDWYRLRTMALQQARHAHQP